MIREIRGDLLKSEAHLICHQVNCKGVMGAGVAKQIRTKVLSKEQFQMYKNACIENGNRLLGKNQILTISENQAVVNMFGEDVPTGTKQDTDYRALYLCLYIVEKYAREHNKTVAIPGRLGCGLAGGDWQYVKKNIIWPIFEKSPVQLTIVYLGKIE